MSSKKKIASALRATGRVFGIISFYCHDVAYLLDPQPTILDRIQEMLRRQPVPEKKDTN